MLILADENIPLVEDLFSPWARIERLSALDFTPARIKRAHSLLVRSVTPINEQLLAGSQVKFVGTATIGTNHLATDYLDEVGIHWVNAPGSNAVSVVEYVISALFNLAQEKDFDLAGKKISLVGAGNIGSRLARRLKDFGCEVWISDPLLSPIKQQELAKLGIKFASLKEVINSTDILSLHTPLTTSGEHPTLNLIAEEELAALAGKVLINTSRGEVINQAALLTAVNQPNPPLLILDVFTNEPAINPEVVNACWLATPHIAGYSLDGKLQGSWQIFNSWCEFVGISHQQQLANFLPPSQLTGLSLSSDLSPQKASYLAASSCYQPLVDMHCFLTSLKSTHLQDKPPTPSQVFQHLRKTYPVRREFAHCQVHTSNPSQAKALTALGFTVTG